MRLDELFSPLNEENDLRSKENVESFIKQNCQPYLEANPNFRQNRLFRGVNKRPKNPFVAPVNQNRAPIDISIYIQQGIDDELERQGFKALRGNSIFATGDGDVPYDYGYKYEIFPIGNFDFTWSSHISDLASRQDFIFSGLGLKAKDGKPFANVDYRINKKIADNAGGIIGDFSHVIDYLEYSSTDLPAAIKSNNEIMIHCEKVLYVPMGFLNAPK